MGCTKNPDDNTLRERADIYLWDGIMPQTAHSPASLTLLPCKQVELSPICGNPMSDWVTGDSWHSLSCITTTIYVRSKQSVISGVGFVLHKSFSWKRMDITIGKYRLWIWNSTLGMMQKCCMHVAISILQVVNKFVPSLEIFVVFGYWFVAP